MYRGQLTTCRGVACDLCDEIACQDDMRAREGVRVCPVCRMKLGLHDQEREEAA